MKKKLILTKQERHFAYIILLHEYEKGEEYDYGLCNWIWLLFGIHNYGFTRLYTWESFYDFDRSIDNVIYNYFPELSEKKPLDGWPSFSNRKWRINTLEECIKETSNF